MRVLNEMPFEADSLFDVSALETPPLSGWVVEDNLHFGALLIVLLVVDELLASVCFLLAALGVYFGEAEFAIPSRVYH